MTVPRFPKQFSAQERLHSAAEMFDQVEATPVVLHPINGDRPRFSAGTRGISHTLTLTGPDTFELVVEQAGGDDYRRHRFAFERAATDTAARAYVEAVIAHARDCFALGTVFDHSVHLDRLTALRRRSICIGAIVPPLLNPAASARLDALRIVCGLPAPAILEFGEPVRLTVKNAPAAIDLDSVADLLGVGPVIHPLMLGKSLDGLASADWLCSDTLYDEEDPMDALRANALVSGSIEDKIVERLVEFSRSIPRWQKGSAF